MATDVYADVNPVLDSLSFRCRVSYPGMRINGKAVRPG